VYFSLIENKGGGKMSEGIKTLEEKAVELEQLTRKISKFYSDIRADQQKQTARTVQLRFELECALRTGSKDNAIVTAIELISILLDDEHYKAELIRMYGKTA
jgi:hypothetical protein